MSHWLPPFVLHHPRTPWMVDGSRMNLDVATLDALPWASALQHMAELEGGAIANPDEQRQVGHYWLRAAELAPTVGQAREIGETAERVRHFAAKVRTGGIRTASGERFTDVLQVGIGGSALGPQLLVNALTPGRRLTEGALGAHFVDNTDPDGIAAALADLGPRLATTLVLVVSKSGGTPETRNGAALVMAALQERAVDVPGHMVAVTGEGSRLYKTAKQDGWLQIFPMWDWVGGRNSIMSAVGMLLAELAGVDTQPLLAGAREMDAWTRAGDWRENPAALLAGIWHAAGNGRGERSMVVLPYSDRLLTLSRYLQQLVMESLGKRLDLDGNVVHQGIAVYGNKGSTDQHAFVQQLRDGRNDFFCTFVQVTGDGSGSQQIVEGDATAGDFLQGFLLGTRRALTEAGRPSVTITLPRVDAFGIGALIALYERAVGLYASLVNINAYHQPGVEAGKKAAVQVLELSTAIRKALTAGKVTLPDSAHRLDADPLEVFYILEHLVESGRAVREGHGPTATWRARRGSDA